MRAATELEPSRADLHDELGTLLVQQSDIKEAGSQFEEAVGSIRELRRRTCIWAF